MSRFVNPEKWPEGEFSFTAPNGTSCDNPFEWVWIDIMGFCGCRREDLFDRFFGILYELHLGSCISFSDIDELILHCLDSKDLTDHGVSIRHCWLTDEGRKICNLLWGEEKK